MTRGNRVRTEGADIVYDVAGEGPPLLLIAGGNGDGTRYGRLAAHLAADYTVASYDRRAEGRSTGDLAADLDMAQAARDAAAVTVPWATRLRMSSAAAPTPISASSSPRIGRRSSPRS